MKMGKGWEGRLVDIHRINLEQEANVITKKLDAFPSAFKTKGFAAPS
jgi:hypothetical protein